MFRFLRNPQTVFHHAPTISHSYQQCMEILVSLYPHQSFFFFFNIAILAGVKWCLIVALICISLMINDLEHLFMYLTGHLRIFFREISIQTLCPFFNRVIFPFILESCSLYILGVKPFIYDLKIFSSTLQVDISLS